MPIGDDMVRFPTASPGNEELAPEVKNRLSHRGHALAKMLAALQETD